MEALGHILCHDMPRITKDPFKDAYFRKGHASTEADVPVPPPPEAADRRHRHRRERGEGGPRPGRKPRRYPVLPFGK